MCPSYTRVMVIAIVTHIISAETTKEPPKDVQKIILKMSERDHVSTPDPVDIKPNLNSQWIHHPVSYQSRVEDTVRRPVMIRTPHMLTKLTKTLTSGFEPYFHKVYFEPFERRPKPITLIAFRKNGILPRQIIKVSNSQSSEVAELQSPFNEVGNLWQDEPGQM